MKKKAFVVLFFTCFIITFLFSVQSFAEVKGVKYSIMVSKFNNKSNWSGKWNLGDAWGAVLTDSLVQTGKFIVIGEKDMREEAMDEQDFAASGKAAGGGKRVATGQMTSAQLLIKGDITHFEPGTSEKGGSFDFKGVNVGVQGGTAEINVVMYIVDASTAQVIASKKCYGKFTKKGLKIGLNKDGFSGDVGGFKKTNSGKAIENAVEEGVDFLVEQVDEIPWTGSVLMVKGDVVYVNRGEREGISKGQMFNVGNSEVLRDPDTGEVLDYSMETVGTVKVVKVKPKISICKIASGNGIKKGMNIGLPD